MKKPKSSAPRKPINTKRAGDPPLVPKQGNYQRTEKEYADIYGVDVRSVRRWKVRRLPLDDPDQMGEYLSPRGRKADEEFEDLPSMVPPPPEDPRENIAIRLDESFLQGEGALAAIARLKKAERERAAAYLSAIATRAPAQLLQNRFREWVGIIEALRKLAKDEPEIRKANELTIDRADMDAAIGQVFAAFRTAARNLPGRTAAKLFGLREHDDIFEVLEREVEVLLRSLTDIAVLAADEADAAERLAETPTAPRDPDPDLEVPSEEAEPMPAPTKRPRKKRAAAGIKPKAKAAAAKKGKAAKRKVRSKK